MKLNNKGFTLVELLAVVVILSVLMAIMVPSVSYLIEDNKEKSYMNLEKNILSAAKAYMSDNRYNIKIDGACTNNTDEKNITHINGTQLTVKSKLPISTLVDSKYLSTNSDNKIINPNPGIDGKDELNLANSYVLVKYQCSTKDYTYTLETTSLDWE